MYLCFCSGLKNYTIHHELKNFFYYIDLRLLKGLVWGLSYRLKSHLYSTLCIVQYIRQETQVGTPRCHTIDRLEVVWSFEGFVVLLLVLRGSVPAIEHVVEFLLHSLRVLVIHFPVKLSVRVPILLLLLHSFPLLLGQGLAYNCSTISVLGLHRISDTGKSGWCIIHCGNT